MNTGVVLRRRAVDTTATQREAELYTLPVGTAERNLHLRALPEQCAETAHRQEGGH